MSHCRDCKYFGNTVFGDWTPPNEGWAFCRLASSQDDPSFPQSAAFAVDAESFHAELAVSPDFGCVQFENKGA